jgi:hypothetical protein
MYEPGPPVLPAGINVNIAIAPIIANTASCAPRSGLPRKLYLSHWQSRKSMPPLRLRWARETLKAGNARAIDAFDQKESLFEGRDCGTRG